MAWFQRSLVALGYLPTSSILFVARSSDGAVIAAADSGDGANKEVANSSSSAPQFSVSFCEAVIYLENHVLRAWDDAQREELYRTSRCSEAGSAHAPPAFSTVLNKYLLELECPFSISEGAAATADEMIKCAHWIITCAISEKSGDENTTTPSSTTTSSVEQQIKVARGGTAKRKRSLEVKTFSLGFTTGDAKIDEAATVLRMKYLEDLRELQNGANNIISTLQNFTARPKTNNALGKVGR
jgi:hypothetical protein